MNHATPSHQGSVLVADDDIGMREFVRDVLEYEGYVVDTYNPEHPDPSKLRRPYDIAVIDLIMPGMNGFDLHETLLKVSPEMQFVAITAYPKQEYHDRCIDSGICEFLVKPFRADHLRFAVRGAFHRRENVERWTPPEGASSGGDCGIPGASEQTAQVRTLICELAPTELPVLISGESGTGKELVARAVHAHSNRAKAQFIPVNCGGLSPSLIESELFGHVQGAFTGAAKTKYGIFEAAHGGTLFLDEVGEIPLEVQAKFLRVLDTGEFMRVGETQPRSVDVRIVSATNRDLEDMVARGQFRRDLLYRLRGGTIALAPLRNRKADIRLLVHRFLGTEVGITPDAISLLLTGNWPGNVRELAMAVSVLKSRAVKGIVNRENVERSLGRPAERKGVTGERDTYRDRKYRVLHEFEIAYFSDLMRSADGNVTRAAQIAGLDRKNLREKLKATGIYDSL